MVNRKKANFRPFWQNCDTINKLGTNQIPNYKILYLEDFTRSNVLPRGHKTSKEHPGLFWCITKQTQSGHMPTLIRGIQGCAKGQMN